MRSEKTMELFKYIIDYFDEVAQGKNDDVTTRLGLYPLDYSYEEGYLELAFKVTPFMLNSLNCMHGGLIATVADITMGNLCFAINGHNSAPTAQMNINYLSPAFLNDHVISKAYCKKSGNTLVSLYCEMTNYRTGKLVATATANFCILKPRKR